jgi:isopenicillin-N epimerase
LVDGAHAPGQLDLDLPAIGADWYTGNLHKWAFAPKGTAFLYAAEDSREGLRTPIVSHPTEDWREALHWPGTVDPSNWLAAPTGLDFLERLGASTMREYQRGLAGRAADLLAEAWGTSRPSPPSMHAAMATVVAPGDHPATWDECLRLWGALRERGVEVPVFSFGGRLLVRVAAQVYNEISDYERLAEAFKGL